MGNQSCCQASNDEHTEIKIPDQQEFDEDENVIEKKNLTPMANPNHLRESVLALEKPTKEKIEFPNEVEDVDNKMQDESKYATHR